MKSKWQIILKDRDKRANTSRSYTWKTGNLMPINEHCRSKKYWDPKQN